MTNRGCFVKPVLRHLHNFFLPKHMPKHVHGKHILHIKLGYAAVHFVPVYRHGGASHMLRAKMLAKHTSWGSLAQLLVNLCCRFVISHEDICNNFLCQSSTTFMLLKKAFDPGLRVQISLIIACTVPVMDNIHLKTIL